MSDASDRFNNLIAVTAAALTCFLALSNIQGGNLADAARDSQIASVSTWNQYQGKRIRQYLLENSISNAVALRTEAMGAQVDRTIVGWQEEAARYGSELEELAAAANGHEAAWRTADERGQLFSFAETFLTISLAGLAIAALIRRRWLFVFSSIAGIGGVVFSLAGFFGWTWLSPAFLLG